MTLLAVALSDDLHVEQLAKFGDPTALERAVGAGLVRIEGARVFPAHPLLAAAARKRSSASERRRVHLALAEVVVGEEHRARHLALAANGPDETLAAMVALAADHAAARGAIDDAGVLMEHAIRLTPPATAERDGRLVDLAEYAFMTGDERKAIDLMVPSLDGFSRPTTRARARMLLIEITGVASDAEERREHLRQALEESAEDPALRAKVMAWTTIFSVFTLVERIPEAEGLAREAVRSARLAGPAAERSVLWALAWARILRGRSIDDLADSAIASPRTTEDMLSSVDRARVVRSVWRGDVASARRDLGRLVQLAEERGQALASLVLRQHLCDLELRCGEWTAASRFLEEWDETNEAGAISPAAERCRALLAAGRGDGVAAAEWAGITMAIAAANGRHWDHLTANRALGTAALLVHDPQGAAARLRSVWEHNRREGVDDPGTFPVAPDLIEALVELGEFDEARAVLERLRRLAEEQEHPWGLASATRGRGLLAFAVGDDGDNAASALEDAAASYERIGLRFDHARTYLSLGRALRRRRKWGAARNALDTAALAFDAIGSDGWAAEARSELARVSARPPAPAGSLTPAERRTVELAAEGRSNKDIASALVVSVQTVEVHLSHAYAKLGVTSRSQLAARLRAELPEPRA